ncbi:MAG: diacylglycerol kinase family lipid kinase [Anaerolineales bacterium]
MKTCVILNPVSGRGQGARLRPRIEAALRASSLDFNLLQTEQPLHAITLAAQALREGCQTIISAGGDGTLNEIVNGIMQARAEGFPSPALGVIGIGTGNDFAASLGLPTKIEDAVSAIKQGLRRKVDIGLLKGCGFPDGRYFANCVGIGFDAAGGILAEKITWTRGLLAYLIAALQNIFLYYKAPTLNIQLDSETLHMPSLLVSIMNGTRIGGGFRTAPNAQPDDGLLDLCIAEEVSRPRMLTLLPHFLKGTQESQPEIQMKRSRQIKLTATKGLMPVQVDGEVLTDACQEVSVEVLPAQLDVLGDHHA